MKVKVDKEEYEYLFKRVKDLEEYRYAEYKRNEKLKKYMEKYMEDFFEHKCMTVMVNRDRNMIVAEVRKNIMDNMFKEQ